MRDDGKILYFNTFDVDYELTQINVVEMIEAGRSRWKIENENNTV
ncbi:MAG: hypothetical protein R3E08_09210 [Thiotrichaceae bacterium]